MIPVLNLAVTDRIVDTIARASTGSESLVSNEKVQVFSPTLSSQVGAGTRAASQIRRLVCNSRSSRTRTTTSGGWAFCRDSSRENPRRSIVSGESYKSCIVRSVDGRLGRVNGVPSLEKPVPLLVRLILISQR